MPPVGSAAACFTTMNGVSISRCYVSLTTYLFGRAVQLAKWQMSSDIHNDDGIVWQIQEAEPVINCPLDEVKKEFLVVKRNLLRARVAQFWFFD